MIKYQKRKGLSRVKENVHLTSMKNAEASVRMEGCRITPEMREQCAKVLSGKATTADCLKQMLKSADMGAQRA